MTKIPVKECTLCGALIRAEGDAIALHREFHKRAVAIKPERRTKVTNTCAHGVEEGMRCILCNCVVSIRSIMRPPVLEEPSRRPPVMQDQALPRRRRRTDQDPAPVTLFGNPPRKR